MFDKINQGNNIDVDNPVKNNLKCKFCKKDMLQINNGNRDSFVCVNCGGRCIIKLKEIDMDTDGSFSYCYDIADKIIWDKIKIITKKRIDD